MSEALIKIGPVVRGLPNDAVTESVGERLKRLRLERGLSQRDISSPGVSYAYISRIEAGARTPSVKALRMLAKKLHVSVEYLETGRDVAESEQRELRLGDAELAIRLGEDTREAEHALLDVRDEALAAGDTIGAARALVGLGFAAAVRGQHLDAVERLEESLEMHRASPHLRPDVYATLGQSYTALGAPGRAVKLFEDCLADVAEAAPADVSLRIRYATLLSYALSDDEDHDRARAVVREMLETEEGADTETRIRLYWAMARSVGIEGSASEALHYIRRALGLLEAVDDAVQLARGYLLAANIKVEEGRLRDARAYLERGAPLLGSNPEPRDVATLRITEARVAAGEGDGATAAKRAREALDALGSFSGGEQGTAVWLLARGLVLQGDEAGANDAYGRALDLLVVNGRRHQAARAADEWGAFLRERGREQEAEPILRRASELGIAEPGTASRR
jgi:transcriptional regulator with XRE-family HTH domain